MPVTLGKYFSVLASYSTVFASVDGRAYSRFDAFYQTGKVLSVAGQAEVEITDPSLLEEFQRMTACIDSEMMHQKGRVK